MARVSLYAINMDTGFCLIMFGELNKIFLRPKKCALAHIRRMTAHSQIDVCTCTFSTPGGGSSKQKEEKQP